MHTIIKKIKRLMSGIIKKLKLSELSGGHGQDLDVYPITSIKAVFDEDNHSLEDILKDLKKGGQSTQEAVQTKLLQVYQTSQYRPSSPTGGSYDFKKDTFTAPDGWKADPTGMEEPLWMSYGTAVSNVSNITWSIPICIAGNYGTKALRKTYVAIVYMNSEVQPASPIGGSYDFDTQTLTPPEGWSTDSTLPVSSSTWCSIKAFYSDDEGEGSAWSTPVRTSQSVINLTAAEINEIASKITLTANQLEAIAGKVSLNAEDLSVIAQQVTLTQDQLSILADQIDIASKIDITGTLNTTDLTINGGNSVFKKDGSGYVANEHIKWDTEGNLTVNNATINNATIDSATMTNANVTGAITATSGKVGGFKISGNNLINDDGAYILMNLSSHRYIEIGSSDTSGTGLVYAQSDLPNRPAGEFSAYNSSHTALKANGNILFSLLTGSLKITGLPSTKPTESNIVWNDNGTLKIS